MVAYLDVEIFGVLGSAPKPELEKVGDGYAVRQDRYPSMRLSD